MPQVDVIFKFEPLGIQPARVTMHHRDSGQHETLWYSVDDRLAFFEGDESLLSISADLIDLGACLHLADRVATPQKDADRHIGIDLPLRNPRILSDPKVGERLDQILRWYSAGRWYFNFRKRKSGRPWESHRRLFPRSYDDAEILLWSGGLDALAGLLARRLTNPGKSFVLFGSGSNLEMLSVQKTLFQALRIRMPWRELLFSQVVLRPHRTKNLSGKRNSTTRLRSFAFLLLGAARALSLGRHMLYVYENGVGAINLPIANGLAGIDHSRAVHPKSLELAGELIECITGLSFRFINPFQFQTKASMCEALKELEVSDLIAYTVSCDSKPRKSLAEDRVRHCGTCTSCLLRRQALAAARISDATNYASIMGNERPRLSITAPLCATLSQLKELEKCFNTPQPWEALKHRYPDIIDVLHYAPRLENETEKDVVRYIITLLKQYVDEWKAVQHHVGSELIPLERLASG